MVGKLPNGSVDLGLIQPRAAAPAAKRKAVCFADEALFIFYFILASYISALDGRIFAIFVSFDRVSLRFLFSIQASDKSTPTIPKRCNFSKPQYKLVLGI